MPDAGTIGAIIALLGGKEGLARGLKWWRGRKREKAEERVLEARAAAQEAEAIAAPRAAAAISEAHELGNAAHLAGLVYSHADRLEAEAEAARAEADEESEKARRAQARADQLEVEAREAKAMAAREANANHQCEQLVGVLRAQLSAVVRKINRGEALPANLDDLELDTGDLVSPAPESELPAVPMVFARLRR